MNKRQPEILLYGLIGILIFSYVTIRVFTIPITIDEAWTLYSFIRSSVWDIITIKNPSTNNHILNTLLAKITTVFSEKEFFMRLPNLLSLTGYIFGSYHLSKQLLSGRVLAFSMFLVLLTNFTLLDFFGLCRGYGLSIGLLMLSIAYLVQAVKAAGAPAQRYIHIILSTAALAFYANIAVLHVSVAIFIITIFILYSRSSMNRKLHSLLLPVIYTVAITVLGGIKLLKQYELGEIFYGGTNNFIDDTLASMMLDYTGKMYFMENGIWTMNIAVSLLVTMLVVHLLFIRKLELYRIVPFMILAFSILMINVQFYIMDIPLPVNRIALFLFPLIILSIFISLQALTAYVKPVALCMGILLALFGIWRFSAEMNFNRMDLWWMDMYSRDVVDDIVKDYSGNGKARVFANWPTDNTVNYYVNIYHSDKVIESPCCTRFSDLTSIDSFDYIYMHVSDDENAFPGLKEIQKYHVDSSLILYRIEKKQGKP